jgi:molybdate-binding protein/DNA-binding XRE family transcriptional regulator
MKSIYWLRNPIMSVVSNLAQLRLERGLSAAGLASSVGVGRQTIYAIESGDYLPNTAVALKLAAALDVTVEQIFRMEAQPAPLHYQEVKYLSEDEAARPGQPVRLCSVDDRLIAISPELGTWSLPVADAFVTDSGRGSKRKTVVELLENSVDFGQRLLIAGCDPGTSVLVRHLKRQNLDLVVEHCNSRRALRLLRGGVIHVAGCHVRDEQTGEFNLPAIRQLFRDREVAAFSFALWEEGLVVAHGNPQRLRTIADLAGTRVTIANREPGAGSRQLLDTHLRKLGVNHRSIRGYDRIADGHLPAARLVQSGQADCCVATAATARMLGLDFVPLASTRYDLVVRRRHLELPQVQALLGTLATAAFRREVECLGGYDASRAGQVLM